MSVAGFTARFELRVAMALAWGLSSTQTEKAVDLVFRFGREPDFVIKTPEGAPYLLRWHVVPRNRWLNVYHHLFLASDPGRAPHDHPWVSRSRG